MKFRPNALFEEEYFQQIYRADYDQRNPGYKHRSYLREVMRVAQTGGNLLDVGCAYGNFLREADGYFKLHGCDISSHAVKIAKDRAASANVFQADILEIRQSASYSYDVITCFDVLEHIPQVNQSLVHLRRLLQPGGAIVATVPVYDTVIGRLVRRMDCDPTHVHKISRYEWLDRFTAAGFQQIDWKGVFRYYFRGYFYIHCCGRIIRRFSPAILITGFA